MRPVQSRADLVNNKGQIRHSGYLTRFQQYLFHVAAIIFVTLIALLPNESFAQNISDETNCEKRFAEFSASSKTDSRGVAQIQKFILAQLYLQSPECVGHTIKINKDGTHRDYLVGLANYFSFGDAEAYLKSYKALRRFNFENDCQKLKFTSQSRIKECSISALMQSFIILEMDNSQFRESVSLDQSLKLLSALDLVNTSLRLDGKVNYSTELQMPDALVSVETEGEFYERIGGIYWILQLSLALALEDQGSENVILFGHSIGPTTIEMDTSAVIEALTGHLTQRRSELVCNDGCFLKPGILNASQYCEARLFPLNILGQDYMDSIRSRNNPLLRQCKEHLSLRKNNQ